MGGLAALHRVWLAGAEAVKHGVVTTGALVHTAATFCFTLGLLEIEIITGNLIVSPYLERHTEAAFVVLSSRALVVNDIIANKTYGFRQDVAKHLPLVVFFVSLFRVCLISI